MNKRTCIVTREILDLNELLRICYNKAKDLVFVANNKTKFGRGAYIKKDKEIVEKAIKKGMVVRALKVKRGLKEEEMKEIMSGE